MWKKSQKVLLATEASGSCSCGRSTGSSCCSTNQITRVITVIIDALMWLYKFLYLNLSFIMFISFAYRYYEHANIFMLLIMFKGSTHTQWTGGFCYLALSVSIKGDCLHRSMVWAFPLPNTMHTTLDSTGYIMGLLLHTSDSCGRLTEVKSNILFCCCSPIASRPGRVVHSETFTTVVKSGCLSYPSISVTSNQADALLPPLSPMWMFLLFSFWPETSSRARIIDKPNQTINVQPHLPDQPIMWLQCNLKPVYSQRFAKGVSTQLY